MKSLGQIKTEKQAKVDQLFKDCGLFFAFSNEQFHANKTPLKEGEKYVHIGAGGYLPKGQVDNFTKGMAEIEKWFKAEIKENKARKDLIVYELNNYECMYTGDIEPALAALGEGFTKEEVWGVYRSTPVE